MERNQNRWEKPLGMAWFSFLCTVSAMLGAAYSLLMMMASLGFVGMYPHYVAIHVLCAVGFAVAFGFYIARIVCCFRYTKYGLYPRWLLYGMSYTFWYGWVHFWVAMMVINEDILYGLPIVLCFVPVFNQIYLINRRHLFVFDESRLVYQPQRAPQPHIPMAPQAPMQPHIPMAPPAPMQPPIPMAPPAPMQPQAEETVNFRQEETEMSLLGARVKNTFLGIGTVIEESPGRIVVDFGHKQQDFSVPNAFVSGILHRLPDIQAKPPVPPSAPAAPKAPPAKPAELSVEEAVNAIRKAVVPVWVGFSHPGNLAAEKKLVWGKHYGTVGKDIYLRGCDVFGWDREQEKHFGMMQIMYAYRGAPDGKSIWMLVHHAGIESIEEKATATWWNTITRDTVFEEWKEPDHGFYHDWTERITFAKTAHNGYAFIGVYKPVQLIEELDESGEMHYIKVYKLVQRDYEG